MKNKSDTPTSASPANPAVDAALSALCKQFGEGTARRLGSGDRLAVETLSTGSIAADLALGVGGLPRGRIVEIFGPESAGKTTLCLSLIAEAQRRGGAAAIIDMEHALDFKWARLCGVDTASLVFAQPDCGEDALTVAEKLIATNAIDVVVIDSVAALIPKSELQGEVGDVAVGALGRLMSQAMRRLTGAVARTRCVVVFTNQLREKIGQVYGPIEYTPGGRALKFFSTIRIDLRAKESLKSPDGTVNGKKIRLRVVKNKVAPPYAEVEFDIGFAEGISNAGTLVDSGIEKGLLEKKGSWIAMNGELIGQGRDAAKAFLRANPKIADELAQKILERARSRADDESDEKAA